MSEPLNNLFHIKNTINYNGMLLFERKERPGKITDILLCRTQLEARNVHLLSKTIEAAPVTGSSFKDWKINSAIIQSDITSICSSAKQYSINVKARSCCF
jgi:hypothetical protein